MLDLIKKINSKLIKKMKQKDLQYDCLTLINLYFYN